MGPFDLLPSDCRERHASKDYSEKYDDGKGEDSSSECFEVGVFLIPDELSGGEEIGVVNKGSKHFEKLHDGIYFKLINRNS